MEKNNILHASMLDLLFDGRNKDYGAYELRNSYGHRLKLAMMGTGGLIILFVCLLLIKRKSNAIPLREQPVIDVTLQEAKPQAKPKIKIASPPRVAPVKMEMKKFTVPKIVKDALVDPKDVPVKQSDKIIVGPVTQHGDKLDGLLASPPEKVGVGGGSGNLGNRAAANYEGEFRFVEVEATFPGGQIAWKKYLERNLRNQTPIDNGAVSGQYEVVVAFLVDKNGNTSEIKVIKAPDPDYGTAAEAIRVIERSGKWNPAIQNGRPVKFRETQKIIFMVNQ